MAKRSEYILEEMKKFEVEVTEVLKKRVIVEAVNQREAEEQAELDWDHGKFELKNYEDFHSSNFKTIREMERTEHIMKTFDVEITETLQRTVTVQAESSEEAMDLVHNQHSEGIHVLGAEDFVDMTIKTTDEREINWLDVLLVEPMKAPKEVRISDTLEALQEVVGGMIETYSFCDEPVEIICNEMGKLDGLPLNRAIYDKNGEMKDIIVGSFLIVGDGEENFESLTPELKEKFAKEFEKPEKFHRLAGNIIAQKIDLREKEPMKKTEMER